jgi:protein involved in temperature-dependent protein secretion
MKRQFANHSSSIMTVIILPLLAFTAMLELTYRRASPAPKREAFRPRQECTIGCAMGNATADGGPFSWKNRDADGSHRLWFVSGGKYGYLAMGNYEGLKMGVNEAGLSV